MTIFLKSAEQVARLRDAGRIVAETYETLQPHIKPGVTTGELDRIAEQFIRKAGASPLYKDFGALYDQNHLLVRRAFPATICTSVNDVVCHGIPDSKQELRDGDIVGIDIGVLYKDWAGDSCITYAVGQSDPATKQLLEVAKRSMELGIAQAVPGNHMGDIGAAIQAYVEPYGYGIVREYGGHGVGHSLHEDPFVPHYGEAGTGLELRAGMVIAVEPMLNEGTPGVKLDSDKWVVRTSDGSRSAQFEHTIAITENGPEILTAL